MNPLPYMEVVENPRRMAGKGAPRDTTFGVLGHTKESSLTRSLGGLVKDTKSGPVPSHFKLGKKGHMDMSEHHIASGNKTEIPGVHMGMSPYPGKFMKMVGEKLK